MKHSAKHTFDVTLLLSIDVYQTSCGCTNFVAFATYVVSELVKDWRARAQRRKQRQHNAYSRMKFGKLLIVIKRQIQMCALQIAPSMTFAVKNLIIKCVHFIAIMWPKFCFVQWIHERVRCRWH